MPIAVNKIGCIVLAAGRSERFGKADKLAADLDGKPMLHHVLSMLCSVGFAQQILVCQPATVDVSGLGFERVDIETAGGLQSDSLRAGLRALRTDGLAGILVALGDMPCVSREHIQRLLERFQVDDPRCIVASGSDGVGLPPALFSLALLEDLARMTGDKGARSLLRDAVLVPTEPAELADVDTPEDLERVSNGL